MPRTKPKPKPSEAQPVMELRVDASNPDSPTFSEPSAEPTRFSTPCSLTGVGAAISGGSLGWVFGFGEGLDDDGSFYACRIAPPPLCRQATALSSLVILPGILLPVAHPACIRRLLDTEHSRGAAQGVSGRRLGLCKGAMGRQQSHQPRCCLGSSPVAFITYIMLSF